MVDIKNIGCKKYGKELCDNRHASYFDEVFIKPKDIAIPSNPEFHARMSFFYGPLGEQVELFNPEN